MSDDDPIRVGNWPAWHDQAPPPPGRAQPGRGGSQANLPPPPPDQPRYVDEVIKAEARAIAGRMWHGAPVWVWALFSVVVVLGALAALGAAVGKDKPSSGAAPAPAVGVLAGQSSCSADLYRPRVLYHVTLRNPGPSERSVTVYPVRRYDDGSENASPLDSWSVDVPARSTRAFNGVASYDVERHALVSCGVQVEGSSFVPLG